MTNLNWPFRSRVGSDRPTSRGNRKADSVRRRTTNRKRRMMLESLEGRRVLAVVGPAIDVAENQTTVTDIDNIGAVVAGPGSQYSISGGADATLFEVDADTGVLSFVAAPDFEMPVDLDVDNEYEVEVTLEDINGNTDSISLSAIVLNVNEVPVADANGPYEIDYGYDLLLDASGSFDVDAGDTLSYQWDLDGDDIADFVTGSAVDTVPGAMVKSLTHIGDNTITLRVMDSGNLSATDTATLSISSTLIYQIPTAAPGEVDIDDYTLVRNGTEIEIRETQSGMIVASGPYAEIEAVQVLGSPRPNVLTVDHQSGVIALPILFDGAGPIGTPVGDALVMTNGTADLVQHNFTNESDGSVEITFPGESSSIALTYRNLEPVLDNLNAANRVFTFVGGSETITLSDDGVVGNNFSRIDSTLGEVVTFLNPTNSLTVDAGSGNDVINVSMLDSLYAASLIISGGAGSDVLDIDGLQIINSPGRGLEINATEMTTISNSRFDGNTATIGGGLLVNGPGTVTIDNSRFENNSATGALATQGGGGIFNNGAVMAIQGGSVVAGNTANVGAGSGGGIFSLGTLTVTDSYIDSNDANRAGGGIEIATGSSLTTLAGTSVAGNRALVGPGNGGGMHITGAGDSVITNGYIGNNFAAEEGGGLWNSTGTMTIDNSIIENNVANAGNNGLNDQGGGGVFNNGGTLVIQNLTDIRFNSAPVNAGNGGGVMTVGGSVTINSSSVLGNDAARAGGGIENNGGVLSIDFGTIGRADIPGNGNTAGINGGGIHVSGAGTTNLQNAVVQGNRALQEGGGLWNSSAGVMTVTSSTIGENTASGALSDQGGGGVFNAGGVVNITSTFVTANIADGVLGSGGGILNDAGGTLSVTDLQLSDNVANRAGGGIESTAGTTTTLTRVNLDRNNAGIAPAVAAPGNGGGLHVTGNGNVAIVGGTVADNVAAREGGGLWNGSGTMTIDGTSIVRNVASGDAADDGGGGIFNNAGVLDIDNALIEFNQADGVLGSGGGIFSLAGSVTIDNSVINVNSANRAGGGVEVVVGTVTMTDSDLTGNDVNGDGTLATAPNPGNGGGLHTTAAATVSIVRGSVVGNVAASEGGGLWNSATGTLTITGTLIDQNVARSAGAASDAQGGGGIFNNGGALNVLAGTRVTNNTALDPDAGATQDDGGGGIFNNGGAVVLMGPGTFIRANLATDGLGNGGGLLSLGGTVTATDVVFDNNAAARAGGGIENNGGIVNLNSVTVTGNSAGINGGGLHAAGVSTTTVIDGLFQANVAGQEGGGLWNGDGLMTINGTAINANIANSGANAGNDQGGGGVFNIGGTLDIDGAIITNNLAAVNLGNGGGVMSVGGIVTIDGGEISGNQAARAGGGIENNAADVSVTNVTVQDNTAGVNGGGLHAGGATSVTSVNSGMFQNNSAIQEGGGLWNGSGMMSINGTSVTANTANSAANAGNDQGGGGVFNIGGSLGIVNASITNNVATANNGNGGGVMTIGGTVVISGGNIAGNQSARAGGGIESNSAVVTLSNVIVGGPNVVDGNIASVNGGGLHVSGTATTNVTNGVFQNNGAGEEGGGLWNSGSGTMTIVGTQVLDNRALGNGADQGGGGIFNAGGTLSVSGATVRRNVANGTFGSGGGTFNDVGGNLSVTNSAITDNVANRAGGGIETTAGTTTTLTNVNLDRNNAGVAPTAVGSPGNGGGLHVSGNGAVTITGGTVNSNVAAEEGGGLWNGSSVMTVTGTQIDGNQASGTGADQGGGGVFNSSGTLSLVNVQLTNNLANSGNGSGGGGFNDQGTLNVRDSDVTGNDKCALSYVRPSGTVINNNFSGNVGGALCPLLGTANDDIIVVTSTVIAINADVFTYDNTLGPVAIESRAGNDRFDVRSTAVANPISIFAGTGNDEINISSDAPVNTGQLDQILGNVTVMGEANLATLAGTAITAKSTTIGGTLVVGDTLNISDNGSAADNTYLLGESTFRRSGVLPTGLITFNTIESLNVVTGSGSDSFSVTTTPSNASVSIQTGDGNDTVVIDDSGDGSVLRVDMQVGDDMITLNGGGGNSAAELRGGIGNDRFDVRSTGSLGAFVGIGGLGDDTFAVSGTSSVTSTDLFGDDRTQSTSDGADTFDFGHTLAQVGSAATGTVANLLGVICVDGGNGTATPVSASVTSRHAPTRPETISQDVTLADAIIYSDAAAAGPAGQSYTVTDTTLDRAGSVATVRYERIESITMRTSEFADTIAVSSTMDGTMLGIVSGGGDDALTITSTGDGSITAIQTGLIEGLGSSDNDTVTIRSTGSASILEVDTDFATPSTVPPAAVSDADTIVVLGRGSGSGIAIRTGSDQDSITIGGASAVSTSTSGTRSLLRIESGDDDDTFTVNEVFLETVVDLRGDAGNDTFNLIATGSDGTGNLGRLNNDPINGAPLDAVARTRELLIDGGANGAGTRSVVEGVSVSPGGAATEGLISGLPTGDTINVNAASASAALDLRYIITGNTNGVLATTTPNVDPNARQTEGNEVFDSLGVENINIVTGGGDDVLTVSGTVPLGIVNTGQVVRFDGNGANDRFEVLGGDLDDRITIGSISDATNEPFEIQNVSYVRVDGGNGDDQVANDTSAISVLDGGLGNDSMLGGSQQDVLTGGGGSDAIFGRGGNDILLSDQDFGDDTLIPAPDDLLDGGAEGGLPGDICIQVGADRVRNCEVLGDGGAEKDVLTWLRAILIPIDSISFADNDPQFEPFGPVAARPAATLSTTEPSSLSPAVAFPSIGSAPAPISVGSTPGEGEMRLDVNGDGYVTALDALRVINAMSRQHSTNGIEGEVIASVRAEADVNADGQISGLDALLIINELARSRARGESESSNSETFGNLSMPISPVSESYPQVNKPSVTPEQVDEPSDIAATDGDATAPSSAWAASVDEFFLVESDDRYASDKEYEKLTIDGFFGLSSNF